MEWKGLILVVVVSINVLPKVFASEASNLQRLSRAHMEFALSLFREVAAETPAPENVLISPYSVASVMSQIWLGAGRDSKTFRDIESVLHYKGGGLTPEKVHAVFQSSLDTLSDSDFQSVVQQANGVFVQTGVKIRPKYELGLKEHYNASVEQVDFEGRESLARATVNRWVRKETGGQIPNLLETPLPAETKILLVNALSLRAEWKTKFECSLTADKAVFHQDSKNKLEIPMMAGKLKVLRGFSSDLRCRLLELPFVGKRLSMFILLPDEDVENQPEALSRLERNLTAANLKKLFATLSEDMVHVRMPRFSIGYNAALETSLSRLGLASVFDPSQTDFSGMSEEEQLSVSSLTHKVVMEITERGAQGAAASAAGIERLGDIDEYFDINRPFVFFIWDYHSGALLFISRVASPVPIKLTNPPCLVSPRTSSGESDNQNKFYY